jgi:hypothetical protein
LNDHSWWLHDAFFRAGKAAARHNADAEAKAHQQRKGAEIYRKHNGLITSEFHQETSPRRSTTRFRLKLWVVHFRSVLPV